MFEQQVLEIRPEGWQQTLNEICSTCGQILHQSNSISLCKCLLFTHEKCFIDKYIDQYQNHYQLRCIHCDRKIEMMGKTYNHFEWSLLGNWKIYTSFVVGIALQILFIVCWTQGYYKGIIPKPICFVMSLIFLIMSLSVLVFFIWKKKFIPSTIKLGSTEILKKCRIRKVKQLNDFSEVQIETYATASSYSDISPSVAL